MEQLTLTNKSLTAEDYKDGLPRTSNGKRVKWTMETFSVYVNLLYPHITLVSGQVWTGNRTKYKFLCEKHGQYEARGSHVLHESQGCQCKGCRLDRDVAAAGTKRNPRASIEEKQSAAKLRSDGLSYREIGLKLGRAAVTINRWLEEDVNDRARKLGAKWTSENKERVRETGRRYQSEFAHAKAGHNSREANRRLQKHNVPELIFLDGQWHEVDRKKTNHVFSEVLLPAKERKAIQELYMEAQYQTETTGVEHHVDHIQPLSKGGEHLMINLQILPCDENLSKGKTFRVKDQALICKRLFN